MNFRVSSLFFIVVLCCITTPFFECSRSREFVSSAIVTEQPKEPVVKKIEEKSIPPLEADEREYFRIQVFAAQNYENAHSQKVKLREYTLKDVSLILEDSLWKVQVGDFPTRIETAKERDIFRRLGWVDAWVVQVRVSRAEQKKTVEPSAVKADSAAVIPDIEKDSFYTVQIIATSNKTEAENIQRNLLLLKVPEVSLLFEDSLWKIQVGTFKEQKDAEAMKNRMKTMGFNDSFVVKRKYSPYNE